MPTPISSPTASPFRFGTPQRGLPQISDRTTPAQILAMVDAPATWSALNDGGGLSNSELAWLQRAAERGGDAVRERIYATLQNDPPQLTRGVDPDQAFAFFAWLKTGAVASEAPTPELPPGQPAQPPPAVSPPQEVKQTLADLLQGKRIGPTAPVAPALDPALQALVVDPDDPDKGFNVERMLAQSYDPEEYHHLDKPSQAFAGVHVMPVAGMLPDDPALAPLKQVFAEPLLVETSCNQYQVEPGKMGNRILFYGDDHAELIALLHDPQFKGKGRWVKFMTHYTQTHWEGDPAKAFADERGVFSTTHGGALFPVVDKEGKPGIGWFDFPVSYGMLSRGEYGATLGFFSLDNIQFTGQLPANWEALKQSTYETMDAMACLQMITVPFSSDDPRPWNTDYMFNILELSDQDKMIEYSNLISKPADPETLEKLRLWSHYCMEGVWNNANYANFPINPWAVEKGLLSQEAYDRYARMAELFAAAGGLEPGQASKGWEKLKAEGLITEEQLYTLERTGMINVPFKVSDPGQRPYTSYGPVGAPTEGLGRGMVGKPLTLAGLLGGKLEVEFPREKTAAMVADRLLKAVQAAARPQEAQALLGGAMEVMKQASARLNHELGLHLDVAAALEGADAQKVAQLFGQFMASQLQLGLLQSEQVVQQLRGAIQYSFMDRASKTQIDKTVARYAQKVADFTLMGEALDKQLRVLDRKTEQLRVTYKNPNSGETRTDAIMSFVPPQYGQLWFNGAGGAMWPGLVPVCNAIHKEFQIGAVVEEPVYPGGWDRPPVDRGRSVTPLGEGANAWPALSSLEPDQVLTAWLEPRFGGADAVDAETATFAANLLEHYMVGRSQQPASDPALEPIRQLIAQLRERSAEVGYGENFAKGGYWVGAYRPQSLLEAELATQEPASVVSWFEANFGYSYNATVECLEQELALLNGFLEARPDLERQDPTSYQFISERREQTQSRLKEKLEPAQMFLGLDRDGLVAFQRELATLPDDQLSARIEARFGPIAQLSSEAGQTLYTLMDEHLSSAAYYGGRPEEEMGGLRSVVQRISERVDQVGWG